MPKLYMVATPIGNLSDITLRALDVLKAVDVVACEDTRHTLALLSHFSIRKPLVSCHSNDENSGASRILGLLKDGKDVAFCSDAGTPCLSDPGSIAASIAASEGFDVVPIPGASAFSALISAAGSRDRAFTFEGFLSPKPGRRKSRLSELMSREEAFVIYESPFRILKTLDDIMSIDPDRGIVIGREMTKIHEEFIRGTVSGVKEALSSRPEKDARGEYAVLVAGAKKR